MATVLIIDDNRAIGQALSLLFEVHGLATRSAVTPDEGLALLGREDIDLVVQDMNFSGAVPSGREGAAVFLAKPWDDAKLVTTVKNLLQLGLLQREQRRQAEQRREARERLAARFDLCGVVYASDALQQVVAIATQVAHADVPVVITGPNGSGKEKLADIIHANSSCRAGPYVKVNMGALPS